MNALLEEDFNYILKSIDITDFKNRTVTITGATGFIGSYLTKFFLWLNETHNMNIKLYLDIRNISKAKSLFGEQDKIHYFGFEWPIDYIFHCASNATPQLNETNFMGVIETNITMTQRLLEIARLNNAKMLFLSAGEIYGDVSRLDSYSLTEDSYGSIDPLITRSNYPETKRVGENLCFSYNKLLGTKAYIARLFHTYGIGINLNDPRIFSILIKAAVTNTPIILHSLGLTERGFCYISNVVEGFFRILRYGEPGQAYNIGNEIGIKIKTLAERISELYGIEFKYDLSQGNKESPFKILLPNCNKIRNLGWENKIQTLDGFKRTIRYYKEIQ